MTTAELIEALRRADPAGKWEVTPSIDGIDLLKKPRKDGFQVIAASVEIEGW